MSSTTTKSTGATTVPNSCEMIDTNNPNKIYVKFIQMLCSKYRDVFGSTNALLNIKKQILSIMDNRNPPDLSMPIPAGTFFNCKILKTLLNDVVVSAGGERKHPFDQYIRDYLSFLDENHSSLSDSFNRDAERYYFFMIMEWYFRKHYCDVEGIFDSYPVLNMAFFHPLFYILLSANTITHFDDITFRGMGKQRDTNVLQTMKGLGMNGIHFADKRLDDSKGAFFIDELFFRPFSRSFNIWINSRKTVLQAVGDTLHSQIISAFDPTFEQLKQQTSGDIIQSLGKYFKNRSENMLLKDFIENNFKEAYMTDFNDTRRTTNEIYFMHNNDVIDEFHFEDGSDAYNKIRKKIINYLELSDNNPASNILVYGHLFNHVQPYLAQTLFSSYSPFQYYNNMNDETGVSHTVTIKMKEFLLLFRNNNPSDIELKHVGNIFKSYSDASDKYDNTKDMLGRIPSLVNRVIEDFSNKNADGVGGNCIFCVKSDQNDTGVYFYRITPYITYITGSNIDMEQVNNEYFRDFQEHPLNVSNRIYLYIGLNIQAVEVDLNFDSPKYLDLGKMIVYEGTQLFLLNNYVHHVLKSVGNLDPLFDFMMKQQWIPSSSRQANTTSSSITTTAKRFFGISGGHTRRRRQRRRTRHHTIIKSSTRQRQRRQTIRKKR